MRSSEVQWPGRPKRARPVGGFGAAPPPLGRPSTPPCARRWPRRDLAQPARQVNAGSRSELGGGGVSIRAARGWAGWGAVPVRRRYSRRDPRPNPWCTACGAGRKLPHPIAAGRPAGDHAADASESRRDATTHRAASQRVGGRPSHSVSPRRGLEPRGRRTPWRAAPSGGARRRRGARGKGTTSLRI